MFGFREKERGKGLRWAVWDEAQQGYPSSPEMGHVLLEIGQPLLV